MFEIYKNLYKIFNTLWKRRPLILYSLIIMVTLSLLFAFLLPKQFIVKTTLLIQNPTLSNPYLNDIKADLKLQNKVNDLDAILHSQLVLEKIATSLNLIKPDMSSQKVQAIYNNLSDRLRLIKPERTVVDDAQEKNLIALEYGALSNREALKELNIITKILIKNVLIPNTTRSIESEQFFKSELMNKKNDLIKAEQKLSQFTTTNATTLPSLHTTNLERLRVTQESLLSKEAELASAKTDLILQQHNLIQLSPELTELAEKIIQAQFNLALLRQNNQNNDSITEKLNDLNQLIIQREEKLYEAKITNINALESIQGQVALSNSGLQLPQSSLLNQIKAYQVADLKVTNLSREVENLKDIIKNLEPSLNNFGGRDQTLKELSLDVSQKRDFYQKLLDRYQKTKVMENLDQHISAEQVKVIDSPLQIPKVKGYTKKMFLLCGVFAGILLGIGLALLLDFVDGTIRYRDQIEDGIGLPVLARIPNVA